MNAEASGCDLEAQLQSISPQTCAPRRAVGTDVPGSLIRPPEGGRADSLPLPERGLRWAGFSRRDCAKGDAAPSRGVGVEGAWPDPLTQVRMPRTMT